MQNRFSSIFTAAENGDAIAVKSLISQGADLNEMIQFNGMWCTPLMVAIIKDRANVVEVFLNQGIDLNGATSEREEYPPIFIAVIYNALNVAKLLIKRGANIHLSLETLMPDFSCVSENNQEYYEWTPIHWAAKRNFAEMVELLIINGADYVKHAFFEYENPLFFSHDESLRNKLGNRTFNTILIHYLIDNKNLNALSKHVYKEGLFDKYNDGVIALYEIEKTITKMLKSVMSFQLVLAGSTIFPMFPKDILLEIFHRLFNCKIPNGITRSTLEKIFDNLVNIPIVSSDSYGNIRLTPYAYGQAIHKVGLFSVINTRLTHKKKDRNEFESEIENPRPTKRFKELVIDDVVPSNFFT